VVCVSLLAADSVFSAQSELILLVDGKNVCVVESADAVERALESVEKEMSERLGYAYKFEYTVSYKDAETKNEKVLSSGELAEALLEMAQSSYLSAYTLYVDGYVIGVFSEIDEEDLNKKIGEYLSGKSSESDSAIYYNVEKTYAKKDDILSLDLFWGLLEAGECPSEEGPIKEAFETLESIVFPEADEIMGIPVQPDQNGTEIVIKHEEVYTDIPYNTVYINSSDIPYESILLKTEGQSGLEKAVYEVRYVNGEEVSRALISKQTVLPKCDREVYIGVDKCAPYGEFIWPTTGYISSGYGYRTLNGKREFHYGIDIATKKGTPIYAADGGKVTYAGYNSSYGYHVLIDHGDYVTCYAHMSKIMVKKGESVYRSQQIGKVGSTGYSFGNHLHFEIRVNGEKVNPLKYLDKTELMPTK